MTSATCRPSATSLPMRTPDRSEGAIITGRLGRQQRLLRHQGRLRRRWADLHLARLHGRGDGRGNKLPLRDFPRPDGIVERQGRRADRHAARRVHVETVTEVFAAGNVPDAEGHAAPEAADRGRDRQDLAGGLRRLRPPPPASPLPARRPHREPEEKVYLDLGRLRARRTRPGTGQQALDRQVASAGSASCTRSPGPAARRAAGADREVHAGRDPDLDAVAVPRRRRPDADPHPDAGATPTPTETPEPTPTPTPARLPRARRSSLRRRPPRAGRCASSGRADGRPGTHGSSGAARRSRRRG